MSFCIHETVIGAYPPRDAGTLVRPFLHPGAISNQSSEPQVPAVHRQIELCLSGFETYDWNSSLLVVRPCAQRRSTWLGGQSALSVEPQMTRTTVVYTAIWRITISDACGSTFDSLCTEPSTTQGRWIYWRGCNLPVRKVGV